MDSLTDEECKAEFRFWKNDIYLLKEDMQLPDEIICYNRLVVSGVEALFILLKRFVYPIRYNDMCSRFARPVPQLSIIASEMMNLVFNHRNYRLTSLQQNWISPASFQNYAYVIHNAGAPYTNGWGFVDGTVRPVCKPEVRQIKGTNECMP